MLALNDAEMDLVGSLASKRGYFSEAFLMAGDERAVVGVESTPLEYWIATTDPRETSLIDRARKNRASGDEAKLLRDLSGRYPHGFTGDV